jgi:lipopolysaccharide biosynthesis protein
MPTSVFLHAYYIDELDRVFSYLENIPMRYRLCITTDDDKKNQEIVEILRAKGLVDFRVATCRNRGRDIAPMLIEFREEFDKCKYAIHIHTKKSPHDSELSGWSDYLYQNLLGSTEIVASILSIFKEYPSVGMIAPEHFYPLTKGVHLGWGKNYKVCFEILKHMGVIIDQHSKLNFPSGSMFWFRTEAIKPLLNLNLQYEDFNEERAQTDGTLAHAIERTFFYACEIAGFSWLNTITPVIPSTNSTKVYGKLFILDAPQLLVKPNDSIKA